MSLPAYTEQQDPNNDTPSHHQSEVDHDPPPSFQDVSNENENTHLPHYTPPMWRDSANEGDTENHLPRYSDSESLYVGPTQDIQRLISELEFFCPAGTTPDLPIQSYPLGPLLYDSRNTTASTFTAAAAARRRRLNHPTLPEPAERVPEPHTPDLAILRIHQQAILSFFLAIAQKQDDLVSLFLNSGLLSPNTEFLGLTPLLAAVRSRSLPTVKLLLEAGAEKDAFGAIPESLPEPLNSNIWREDPNGAPNPMMLPPLLFLPYVRTALGYRELVYRTPLQYAASLGHLPLVKLLLEEYGCDDSLVAPDGQIALRLASAAGHREVVEYLPVRRGGGWLRWKTAHEKSIKRITKAAKKIGRYFQFVFWDVPRFFFWEVPKYTIVLPVWKRAKWCWVHRREFGPWVKTQIGLVPERLRWVRDKVVQGLRKVPEALLRAWRYVKKEVPLLLKRWKNRIWRFITKDIPHGAAVLFTWLKTGVLTIVHGVTDFILRTLSLLHTVFMAVLTFFRNLTLRDIWRGFCALLEAVFVLFPKKLWQWVKKFGEVSFKVLEAWLGSMGMLLWYLVWGLGFALFYVPRKLWVIVSSLGDSIVVAVKEVVVWISPKA